MPSVGFLFSIACFPFSRSSAVSVQEIHFIREVLVADYQGKTTPTMQVSDANASCVHPVFVEAAFYEAAEVRTLYAKLGGARRADDRQGSTVIIPNRSRWATLWGISAEEATVVQNTDSNDTPAGMDKFHTAGTRARDRMMRD
jgi:hypothetical protein